MAHGMVKFYQVNCSIRGTSARNSNSLPRIVVEVQYTGTFPDPVKTIATIYDRNDDETIQLLESIAQHIFGDGLKTYQ